MMRQVAIGGLILLTVVGCNRVEEIAPSVSAAPILLAEPGPHDWPCWRGPNGNNRLTTAPDADWSHLETVWTVPLAGRAHSSPILSRSRVYLTNADQQAMEQSLAAFDGKTGAPGWTTVLHRGGFMPMHAKNSHASATPATDGERIFAVFINADALRVSAIDLAGKVLWQSEAGPFRSQHGYGSSPVLYESLVIVAGDNPGGSFLAGLHRATGEVVWRVRRPTGGSYATPIVARLAGRDQLLLSGVSNVTSYDPRTGERLWFCAGPAATTACTVAFDDDCVIATGGYPEKELIAIRADGTDNVTDTHVLWRTKRGVSYVPSPIVADGNVYVVNDRGVATCFGLKTGKQIWTHRLGGDFSASPLLVDGQFLVANETGTLFVFRAGPRFELLARRDFDAGFFASPVVAEDRVLLRSANGLICLRRRSEAANSQTGE